MKKPKSLEKCELFCFQGKIAKSEFSFYRNWNLLFEVTMICVTLHIGIILFPLCQTNLSFLTVEIIIGNKLLLNSFFFCFYNFPHILLTIDNWNEVIVLVLPPLAIYYFEDLQRFVFENSYCLDQFAHMLMNIWEPVPIFPSRVSFKAEAKSLND